MNGARWLYNILGKLVFSKSQLWLEFQHVGVQHLRVSLIKDVVFGPSEEVIEICAMFETSHQLII